MGKGWPLTGLYPSYLQDRIGITVYILCLMLCLFAPDYQTDHARSNLKKKVTMLIPLILFIFIDIDNTYTCTYVVSRLFAPRTIKLYSSGFTSKYVI